MDCHRIRVPTPFAVGRVNCYLLAHHASTLDEVVTSAGVDAECAVARDLVGAADGVEGFGCSDCDCASHLFYHADRSALMDAVENAHRAVR